MDDLKDDPEGGLSGIYTVSFTDNKTHQITTITIELLQNNVQYLSRRVDESINKQLFLFFSLIIFLLPSCKTQQASVLYKKNLHIVERRVNHDPSLNLSEVEPAILFFEEITGIQSESNGDYIGRYKPTMNDYNRWLSWFEQNKRKLYWDNNEKKVKVRKTN